MAVAEPGLLEILAVLPVDQRDGRTIHDDVVAGIDESMDKTAHISKLVLLGNAAKLPGLRQFLNKQLEIDIAKITDFKNLTGAEVINEKAFKNNNKQYILIIKQYIPIINAIYL